MSKYNGNIISELSRRKHNNDHIGVARLLTGLSMGKHRLKDGTPIIYTYKNLKEICCDHLGYSVSSWSDIQETMQDVLDGKICAAPVVAPRYFIGPS